MMRTPFDDAAAGLVSAIAAHSDADAALALPGSRDDGGPTIDVHLLGVHAGLRERHRTHHHLPVELDHIVAVNAPADELAGLIHDVMTAIESSPTNRLSDDDVPVDWWAAFDASPRPAIRVRTPVHIDRSVEEAPIVTDRVVLESTFHRAGPDAVNQRKG